VKELESKLKQKNQQVQELKQSNQEWAVKTK
jgi:hypothetical protein